MRPSNQGMAALAERALASARAQEVGLLGARGGVKDWDIVDAATVTVRDALPGGAVARSPFWATPV
jgi:hypothetical protein